MAAGCRQPGVRAAQLLGHIGMELREALDVDLVEDRVGHRPTGSAVIAPLETRSAVSTERGTYGAESLSSARFGSSAA